MGVVDQRHPRLAQPQRGEERDPVDDLEDDVGVGPEPAHDRPGGAREHRAAASHPVHDEVRRHHLDRRAARVLARDERHLMAPQGPADDVLVDVGAGAAALGVGPVAVGQDQDLQRPVGGAERVDVQPIRPRPKPPPRRRAPPGCRFPCGRKVPDPGGRQLRYRRMQSASTSVAAAPDSGERTSGLRRAWGWWSRRPTLAAAVIYAVLAVVMVGQGLEPGRTLSSSDGLLSSVPWQAVQARPTCRAWAPTSSWPTPPTSFSRCCATPASQLPDVPLWNPYIMAGRPLLADGQSAVFSPFSVPVVHPAVLEVAGGRRRCSSCSSARSGAFLLARVLGMRFGGALLAGRGVRVRDLLRRCGWPGRWPASTPSSPGCWLLTELLVRRPGRLPVAGLAAVVGLQFLGGHPESSFHAAVHRVGVLRLPRSVRGARRRGRRGAS